MSEEQGSHVRVRIERVAADGTVNVLVQAVVPKGIRVNGLVICSPDLGYNENPFTPSGRLLLWSEEDCPIIT